jgi:hypothetical protein
MEDKTTDELAGENARAMTVTNPQGTENTYDYSPVPQKTKKKKSQGLVLEDMLIRH